MAKDKTDAVDLATAGNGAIGLINRVDVATQKFQPGARRGSIIASAKNNLFEFPVFISNTIPLDYATAANALLEQLYAAYLQMAISQNPVVDAKSVKNGLQFADLKTDVNKYLEYTECDWQHEACHNVIQEAYATYEFDMLSYEDRDARVINEAYDYQPLTEFSHFFQEAPGDNIEDHVARYPLPRLTPDGTRIEDPITFDGYGTLTELRNRLTNVAPYDFNASGTAQPAFTGYMAWLNANHIQPGPSVANVNNADAAAGPNQNLFQRVNTGMHNAVGTIDNTAQAVSHTADAIQKVANLKDTISSNRDAATLKKLEIEREPLKRGELHSKTTVSAPTYIDDAKCQKLNTMKPLLMQVSVNMLNKDDSLQPLNFVVGVKCHMRVVPADILPEVATYPLQQMDKVARKVKWRAGELKFLKDIVFRINEKKQTAADSRDPKRKWYRRLYELAHMKGDAPASAVVQGKSLFASFIRDKQGKGKMMHGMIPNASIIISQNDVVNIKAQTKIDLLKGSTAKKFCGELFLMSLIVIDPDAESVKIMLPDINDDYDVHSMASINKQLATLDTAGQKTRDIFKMLG